MSSLRETLLDWALVAWNTLLELGLWLHEKSAEWNWLSWITHAVFAVPIALSGSLGYMVLVWVGLLPQLAAGVSAGVTFYLWRELEQIAHRLMGSVELDPWDHTMDVVVPALALVLLAWWAQ